MSEAITREEQLLNAIATGEPAEFRPITREEKFLAKAGGQDVKLPKPITRKEMFLQKIIDNGGGGGEPLIDGSYVWKKYTGVDVGLYSERDPLQLAIMSGFDSLKYAYGKPVVPLWNEMDEVSGHYIINENEIVLRKTDGEEFSAPYTLLDDGITLECTDPNLFIPEGWYMNGSNVLIADFKGFVTSDDEFTYPNNEHDGQYYYIPYGHENFRHDYNVWMRMTDEAVLETENPSFTLSYRDGNRFYVYGDNFQQEGVTDYVNFFDGFTGDMGTFTAIDGVLYLTDNQGAQSVATYDALSYTMTFDAISDEFTTADAWFSYDGTKEWTYLEGVNNYTVSKDWDTFEDGVVNPDGWKYKRINSYQERVLEVHAGSEMFIGAGTLFTNDAIIKAMGDGGADVDPLLAAVNLIERSMEISPWTDELCEKVTTIGIGGCAFALTPILNFPNLISVGQMGFYGCMMLQQLFAPKLEYISSNAFTGCALTEFNLPSVTTVEIDAFSGSSAEVITMENLEDLGDRQYSFQGAPNLREVNFPKLKKVGHGMFAECPSLETFEHNVVNEIGSMAFYNSGIKTVNVPNVTLVKSSAFRMCENLEKLDISSKCHFEKYSLASCTNISALILRYDGDGICTALPEWLDVEYSGEPNNAFLIEGTDACVYVPASKMSEYQADSVFGAISDRFRAIEDYPEICG